jgi:site-specific DNA-methyltransferase (cytosine-N4-specific)
MQYPLAPQAAVVHGDCLDVLRSLPDGCVNCCVTSPPYWGGLRDYGHSGQLGLERDPSEYATALTRVFREVSRVLANDGALWLNLGDVYAASGKGGGGSAGTRGSWNTIANRKGFRMPPAGYKMKDLTLVPFLVANSLRLDGWYLRAAIVWEKPNAGEPERLDRPSLSHEHVFLFAKAADYKTRNPGESWWHHSVWRIPPAKTLDHPATMPYELARRCVVSSSSLGDLVLDPFGGSGTTAHACIGTGRRCVSIELNPEYVAIAQARIDEAMGRGPGSLFASVPEDATNDTA